MRMIVPLATVTNALRASLLLLFLIVNIHTVSSNATRVAGKTSFLIILADDLGSGHVGYNGGIAKTPNIDKLATGPSTIQFTSFHSTPVCSPSRASLYAGQIPERNCVPGVDTDVAARNGMTTIATDATGAGYKTSFFGKWHLAKVAQNSLGKKGFQHWMASPLGLLSWDPTCWCQEAACNAAPKPKCHGLCYSNVNKYCSAYASSNCYTGYLSLQDVQDHIESTYGCQMMNGTTAQVLGYVSPPTGLQNCYFVGQRAEAFLNSLEPTDPFLMVVAFHEVHIPYIADPQLRLQSEKSHNLTVNSPIANFVTVVESIDKVVGNLYSLLEQLDRVKDTFVFFAADNGPESPLHGGIPPNTNYRGFKRELFEGGIRVPAVISWPGHIDGFYKVNTTASLLDIRPTIRDILLMDNPDVTFVKGKLDGISLMPVIDNPVQPPNSNRELFVCGQTGPFRKGICTSFALIQGSKKMISLTVANLAFTQGMFDMTSDPYEQNNLMTSQPVTFSRMLKRAQTLAAYVRSSFKSNKCPLRKGR